MEHMTRYLPLTLLLAWAAALIAIPQVCAYFAIIGVSASLVVFAWICWREDMIEWTPNSKK
ncbi:MAG: hypothetical protein IMF05_06785 [Proteobacteria bacterium]|nr:hypothetical protein [Pseudomonadota bacterium]